MLFRSVTETSAYPYVLPYVEEGRNPQALLRAAALTARHPGLPQAKEPRSLGYALAAMTRKQNGSWPDADRPDVIARRLVGIDRLNMDNAAHTIDTILTYADRTGIAVDYYDLARLLTHWGNGVSPESVHVRRSILNNYYRRAA